MKMHLTILLMSCVLLPGRMALADQAELDLAKQTVNPRVAGAESTNRPQSQAQSKETAKPIRLRNVPFTDGLILFAQLSGRVILLHPAVSQAPFTEIAWTNANPTQAEVIGLMKQIFQQREAAVLEDGRVFLQIIPASMAQTATLGAKNLRPGDGVNASGMIHLQGVEMNEVVNIYGKLVGRQRADNNPVTGKLAWFHTNQPLSQAEVVYALETLLVWNDVHLTLNPDNTFSASK